MEAPQSPKKAIGRPRSRKSIAHIPSGNEVRDKENLTVDTAGLAISTSKNTSVGRKNRSKSIGPGGLDALQSDAGNRQKSPVAFQYKSILKPSIPFSPPKAIPPRNASRKGSPGRPRKSVSPEKSGEGLLIDFSMPPNPPSISVRGLPNPFEDLASIETENAGSQSPTGEHGRIMVRTEEEQQASAKERERQDMVARKDARRKSLANRRVSFAPEATLHTWDVVEMPEDSTTSSASTNLTRRASSLSAATTSPFPQARSPIPSSDASEPPSTPPQQVEEVQVSASPAHQRDLHQKKRRRSSGIPPMNFNNPDDFSSSPTSIGSANGDDSDHTVEVDAESSDSDDKDLVEDETVTGIDGEELTTRSNSSSSTGSSGRLEEALRLAARQAGTQGIDYDENGDITMEMADDEVTTAFQPWLKQDGKGASAMGNPSALQDQENINPFSPAFKARFGNGIDEDREETMEFTKAVGTILPANEKASALSGNSPQKVQPSQRRRSNGAKRRSSGASSSFSDETMDLTVAVGGIRNQKNGHTPQRTTNSNLEEQDEDDEMTMDFTAVIGGVLNSNPSEKRRESGASLSDDEDMDFTVAGGGILQSITERTEPEDDTMGMDITTAIGAFLPEQLRTNSVVEAKDLMERETDNGQLSGSTMYRAVQKTPEATQLTDMRLPEHVRTIASETGSPSIVITEGRGSNRRDFKRSTSLTPKPTSRQSTPSIKPTTPSKQLTPRLSKPETPGKTPPLKNISMRTGSPKKLFKAEIKQAAPSPRVTATDALFQQDLAARGSLTPNVVLKPRSRRSSGVGVDRSGIGSPRVTELLDRRSSIGESAEKYVLQAPAQMNVRFADPQTMEQELDQDRAEENRRESGLHALQEEADDQDLDAQRDVTTSLKDKIESLTPQKKKAKLNGRKSLHVGAARGLLGKRPAELDSEEDEEDSTPKRLKGREASPVKKIKLPAPPPKSATTGRMTRSGRGSLIEVEGNSRLNTPVGDGTPAKGSRITTPRDQPRFKDAGYDVSPAKTALFSEPKNEGDQATIAKSPQEQGRIRLQDFLNLTSIRFMELTTTKRRHTLAPNGQLDPNVNSQEGEVPTEASSELESCVVAGACTLPMLDLYQHSCRELKKYITEGRTIVREIEEETFEENPPLFREYSNAPADVKSIMDNQFKNVKTHARLLSKAMWYEWRMKLLDGLKEGLLKNGEGMDEDTKALSQQEQLINLALPDMLEEQDQLEDEARNLQSQADDLANCNQEELKDARSDLINLEEDLAGKRKIIADLQAELAGTEERIDDATERRHETSAEIQEAERMRQNCQGWEPSEVKALQASVAALEQEHGWTITSAADAALTMTYNHTLQLYFSPHSFLASDTQADTAPDQANSSISLVYIADAHEHHPKPLTTEKRFFLQIMRAQLQFLEQSKTRVNELLAFVSSSWQKACRIAEEARVLGSQYITEPTILSDETLAIRSAILLRKMKTKVNVSFEVGVRTGAGAAGIDVSVKPSAAVVYGEALNEKKMGDFLEQKTGGKRKGKNVDGPRWGLAVRELEDRLIARGKKS